MKASGRDMDIGYPRMKRDVDVKNLSEVTAKIEETTEQVQITIAELEKIKDGTWLGIDETLEEV